MSNEKPRYTKTELEIAETVDNNKGEIRKNREEVFKKIQEELSFQKRLSVWLLQALIVEVALISVFYFIPSLDLLLRRLLLVAGSGWVIFSLGASIFLHKRNIKKFAKEICLNLAVDAAEELEQGNMIKGILLTRLLFQFFGQFTDKEVNLVIFDSNNSSAKKLNFFDKFFLGKIGTLKIKMDRLFLGKIEKIHENSSEIAMGITEDQKSKFVNNLKFLAYSIFLNEEIYYDIANEAMKWFIDSCKNLSSKSTGLKKYASLLENNTVEKLVGIAEALILFLLWYFFGWQLPT